MPTLTQGQTATIPADVDDYVSIVNRNSDLATIAYAGLPPASAPAVVQGRTLLGPFTGACAVTITATSGSLFYERAAGANTAKQHLKVDAGGNVLDADGYQIEMTPLARASMYWRAAAGTPRFIFAGDSYTVGTGATVPATGGWAPLLAAMYPTYGYENIAIAGKEIQLFDPYVANLADYKTITAFVAGTNNWLFHTPDYARLQEFESEYMAMFSWYAVADDRKTRTCRHVAPWTDPNPAVTFAGSWAHAGLAQAGSGYGTCQYGTTLGATATFPLLPSDADTLLVWHWRAQGSAGAGEVKLNGAIVGTLQTGGRLTSRAAQGNGNASYWSMYLTAIPITPGDANQVQIRVSDITGPSGVSLAGIAGINSRGNNGGLTLIAPHPYLTDSAFSATFGHVWPGGTVAPSTFWYQSNTLAAYQLPIRKAISSCQRLGLNVLEVPLDDGWTPSLHVSGDNIHPSDAGHKYIASRFKNLLSRIVG